MITEIHMIEECWLENAVSNILISIDSPIERTISTVKAIIQGQTDTFDHKFNIIEKKIIESIQRHGNPKYMGIRFLEGASSVEALSTQEAVEWKARHYYPFSTSLAYNLYTELKHLED